MDNDLIGRSTAAGQKRSIPDPDSEKNTNEHPTELINAYTESAAVAKKRRKKKRRKRTEVIDLTLLEDDADEEQDDDEEEQGDAQNDEGGIYERPINVDNFEPARAEIDYDPPNHADGTNAMSLEQWEILPDNGNLIQNNLYYQRKFSQQQLLGPNIDTGAAQGAHENTSGDVNANVANVDVHIAEIDGNNPSTNVAPLRTDKYDIWRAPDPIIPNWRATTKQPAACPSPQSGNVGLHRQLLEAAVQFKAAQSAFLSASTAASVAAAIAERAAAAIEAVFGGVGPSTTQQ